MKTITSILGAGIAALFLAVPAAQAQTSTLYPMSGGYGSYAGSAASTLYPMPSASAAGGSFFTLYPNTSYRPYDGNFFTLYPNTRASAYTGNFFALYPRTSYGYGAGSSLYMGRTGYQQPYSWAYDRHGNRYPYPYANAYGWYGY